ncbi:large subunit ribosomal protein L21 [Flexibacter flexilis DSM 6793]|uniref:Large ribosomal subunit protein bL21 n=1 Tax=Flexibacter flexilis DSM 6793 TaxID=927664 RepID=A0A1I1F5Z7_9BACT|nr:50S ribosomal protein L21 [Flexibacter flexilis]SFB94754.1 large subunit ribosomal protein L21 [Flexibacter flexilis DSM 6793]
MYAIVEIAGQQFKVQKDQYLYVNKLTAEVGAALSFDKVLFAADGSDIKVGVPTVAGAKVSATVLAHVKGETLVVFKKKRRKGYRRRNGHRQPYTKIQIDGISL